MHVVFWTTNDCNLNCSYCYNRIGNNIKKEYMTKEVADAAIDMLTKLDCWETADEIAVQFHGGEPLMNCDIIEYIMERFEALVPASKLYYGMTTNGTLYDERRKKIINKINELSLSLDGKAEIHDLNRKFVNGKGSFEQVMATAKDISKKKDVRLRMTVTRDTIGDLCVTVCYFLEEGFSFFWRPRPDSNGWWRFCRPLPYHLATGPLLTVKAGVLIPDVIRIRQGKRRLKGRPFF